MVRAVWLWPQTREALAMFEGLRKEGLPGKKKTWITGHHPQSPALIALGVRPENVHL